MQGFDKSGRPTVVTYASKHFPNKEKGVVEEFKRKFSDLPSSQDNYQERLQKVYLVHVPSVFMDGWKLISPFIDSNTGKKIVFVENKNLMSTLLEDIDVSQLPEVYGGKQPLVPIEEC
ncbi:hypothetical protein C5167_031790 [Papaver somniferum]|uniref:CRAL-TRIO domain-containing protein n=1 Tax=Papaver somniferum TaxID=3469 RepID=A0A4Y7K8A7_PAPSO|nr:SEC14 cytosolic factor-like [Papaver somniferum]XP_026398458.1 SEC14 cytosolic factor-like [Papaver somniferum]RZC68562.1 hypothetical protein C5167_031790 [Papaver somniferum]